MRKPTEPQAALLMAMGDRLDILRCDPASRPAWWLEGGKTVNSQVASSVVAAGWAQTDHYGPITRYTRTEAGRTALASTKGQSNE